MAKKSGDEWLDGNAPAEPKPLTCPRDGAEVNREFCEECENWNADEEGCSLSVPGDGDAAEAAAADLELKHAEFARRRADAFMARIRLAAISCVAREINFKDGAVVIKFESSDTTQFQSFVPLLSSAIGLCVFPAQGELAFCETAKGKMTPEEQLALELDADDGRDHGVAADETE